METKSQSTDSQKPRENYGRGQHPNSRANLRQAHNPNGRPKNGCSITAEMRKLLPLPCKYDPKLTWAQYLAERGLSLAATKPDAMKNVQDRLEGKVPEQISAQITGSMVFVIGKGYEGSNK